MCANQFSSSCLPFRTLGWVALLSVVIGSTRANAQRHGPEWSRGMVWYQVFPERFANGNPHNDPTQERSTTVSWGLSFDETTIEEVERAWMLSAGEPRRFGYDPNRQGGSIANVIFQRRYGGDLQGVYTYLDELQSLGVQGIYICPIFTSTSLHKYDAADHRHIDPTLGHPGETTSTGVVLADPHWDPSDETTWGWTTADEWFIEVFVKAVHDRGMKLMLDGVWNHVGIDHWAFNDVRKQGDASRFADWFEVEFDDNGKLAGWKSWNGWSGGLPVFQQTEHGDLVSGPKEHIMAVTRRWMDPNGDGDPSDGIDGWRLDVANEVGRPFWKDWRELVKSINPEALIVGEIWFDAAEYFDGTAFDSQMNYPIAFAVSDWLSIGHMKGDAESLAGRLGEVYSHDLETDLGQLNLMTSHDTERLGSLMENDFQRGFDNEAHPWRHSDRYERDLVSDDAMVRALVSNLVMVANPGSVMIYNGDEFGMVGADDPDNRRPIPESYLSGSGLDDRQIWYLEQLRWVCSLLNDDRIGMTLRYGSGAWDSSSDRKILRIIRRYRDQEVVVDIGPTSADWTGWSTQEGEVVVNKKLVYGESSWSVQVRLKSGD